MSTVKIADVEHQVVIVRRPHDDHDDGHHGGVWKIAFADFMTAMMCFFLVMWLISAADEKTKAAVANYFNPVKLMDRNSSRKGLESIGDGPNAVGLTAETPQDTNGAGGVDGRGNAGPSTEQHSAASADAEKRSDDHLFADPYAVLAEIAANSGVRQNVSDKGDGGVQQAGPATGASGGESYRDPFAPDFWSQQVAVPLAAEASAERPKPQDTTVEPEDTTAKMKEQAASAAKSEAAELTRPKPVEPVEPLAGKDQPSAATARTAEQLAEDLAKAFPAGDRLHDGVSVTATDKGVTISITDQLDFGMFEIGSAVPRRELVLAMEKIGKALNAQKGKITISGHTDARPFKSEAYDNWRLSSARAHSAYYMLVRAGLDERRITEVSGFADRKLKDGSDPLAATNRRIEITLETSQ
ncbi:MotB family protein [Borborobacter arsenicus]|uniref:MotB family protein n=1 Tax=Borborobacter arsenicus TaxID=1851146 RepID=UPI0026848DF3